MISPEQSLNESAAVAVFLRHWPQALHSMSYPASESWPPTKGNIMKDNRVVARIGARILTPQEIQIVRGGVAGTDTRCTFTGDTATDGDPGEC